MEREEFQRLVRQRLEQGQQRLQEAWERLPRWALALAAVFVLFAIGWLIWPFWHLAGQFDSHAQRQPSRLYAPAPELRVDGPLRKKDLLELLSDLGYREVDGAALEGGTFHQEGRVVEIARREFRTATGPGGGTPVRVSLGKGAVASLTGPEGEALGSVKLDPPRIASYYGPDLQERRPIALEDLPQDLVNSVLAVEDAGFWHHSGVSVRGILRAAWVNLRSGEVTQGGSTLTQQLVKNLFLTHERRFERKMRELVLAVLLELRFEKRDILETYLNEIFWGRSGAVNVMGVGAASWTYFGRPPQELTLGESALLAGMIQSPTNFSPRRHPQAARERRDFVLDRLGELEWIDDERLEAARQEPVDPSQMKGPLVVRRAPFFAEWVQGEAERRFGVASLADKGFELHATLSLDDQQAAEDSLDWGLEALEKGWEKGRGDGGLEGALVSVDPRTGGVLAWVGGRDYGRSQFDRVSQARRQAGSVWKPIVFATAFERKVAAPVTPLEDRPFTVQLAGQTWSPGNSDGTYRGLVSARAAMEESLNVPTARLAQRAGLEHIVHMARRFGVESPLEPYPSIALGAMEVTPLEMATVYATLASGGLRPTLHGLVSVFDGEGNEVPGDDLPLPKRVIDVGLSDLVTDVLQGVLVRGTGKTARRDGLKDALAGKTGTTNSRRDSWFAGYSPERATLVWVGYDDNRKTRLSGARAALPVWNRFTYLVRPAGGFTPFERSDQVVEAYVDPQTGGLATDRCPEVVVELFWRQASPGELCPFHRGYRAWPLEQPDGIDVPRRQNRFWRWLDRIRGRRPGRQFG